MPPGPPTLTRPAWATGKEAAKKEINSLFTYDKTVSVKSCKKGSWSHKRGQQGRRAKVSLRTPATHQKTNAFKAPFTTTPETS